MTSDPLAGYKEAINEGRCVSRLFPDQGQKLDELPLQEGQVIKLRSCSILVGKPERIKNREGKFIRVPLSRYGKHKPYFLGPNGGVENPEQAIRAQDDPDPATVGKAGPDPNLRPPPEPEGVPLDEIKDLKGSRESRQLYQLEMAEARMNEETLPISERIRRLEECPGLDLTRQFARIRQAVEAAEAKRRRLATAIPSDHAA